MSQQLKIDNFIVNYQNNEELLVLKKEIFAQHCYYFATSHPKPAIIDAGAHIGLATLYFKKQWPAAAITAVEPHPTNFNLLEENVWSNNLSDMKCLNAALADQVGEKMMFADTQQSWLSTNSFKPNAWNGQQKTNQEIKVKTITLSSLITQPIDMIKLDIEGAELNVLKEARTALHNVNRLFIEFHPHQHNHFADLIDLLNQLNFQLKFSKNGQTVSQKDAQHGLVLIEAYHL